MSEQDRPFSAFRGRRKGRQLRAGRARVFDQLLPTLRLDTTRLADAGDWRVQFPDSIEALWLEIGFGSGEHLLWQMAANPRTGFIGCEPFINGMAAFLSALPEASRPRVRVHDDDALPILRALPDGSLSRCFILFPDPWPKNRHADRRFVQSASVAELARTLAPGAELRFASDDPGMIDWALMHLRAEPALQWQAASAADWRKRPDDWPETRYERKAIAAGRKPAYLRFLRSD